MERIPNMEELLITKPVPEYLQINETLESLAQIRYDRRYPNLISKYRLLGKYCGKTIYMFFVTNFPYSKSDIEEKFEELSLISLCRMNKDSPDWENVQKDRVVCLYIGRSSSIRETLKEHLFLYRAKTHAMHLKAWFPKDLPITINIWGVHDFLNVEYPESLQIIEDILRAHYQPLFGRRGII